MVKIAIDAGHGNNTAGKRAPDDSMREFHFNSVVAKYVNDQLKSYKGVQTIYTHDPTGKRDVPLAERTNKANNWNATAFISIHANAYTGVWHGGGGIETYAYTSKPRGSTQLATKIQDELIKATGLRNRGVKFANFHVLRQSKMDAILAECGFMDNKTELALLKSDAYRKKCATAIVKGIAAQYKLSKTSTSTVAPSKPVSKPKTSNKSTGSLGLVDYMVSKKMDSSYANRKKLAAQHGINSYKGTAAQNTALLSKLKGGASSTGGTQSSSKRYPLPTGTLRQGSRGNGVRQLQRALNKVYFKVGKIDGVYGKRTEDAVRRFQMVHDAHFVDGIYGRRTRTRLDKLVN